MKVFEITALDGRKIRHQHLSVEKARNALMAGYSVTGEIVGAKEDLTGGYVLPIGEQSLLALLLERHGDDLRAWLVAEGYTKGTV